MPFPARRPPARSTSHTAPCRTIGRDTKGRLSMTTTANPVNNGVNTEALLAARDALSDAPQAADFTWRASCSWINGTYSRSTIERFSGLGQEHTHKDTFTVDADHPECFASEDRGATPVEHVLAALAGCLTAGVAAV